MSRPVTIRVQKVKKNRIRERLFFFLFLVVVLVLVSFFADQIVPYDPYGQNLSLSRQPRRQHILWELTNTGVMFFPV